MCSRCNNIITITWNTEKSPEPLVNRHSHRPIFAVHSTGNIENTVRALNRSLKGRYCFTAQGTAGEFHVALYDTFDWRLLKKGYALMRPAMPPKGHFRNSSGTSFPWADGRPALI